MSAAAFFSTPRGSFSSGGEGLCTHRDTETAWRERNVISLVFPQAIQQIGALCSVLHLSVSAAGFFFESESRCTGDETALRFVSPLYRVLFMCDYVAEGKSTGRRQFLPLSRK